MPDNLVEIGQYLTSAEAAIVRGQLDAEGIRAELASESVAGWLWHMGPAVGGVRLLVAVEDLARAEEIIGEIHGIDETEDVGQRVEVEEGTDEQEPDETADEREELPDELIRAWRASLIGLFLLPPLLNLYSSWLLVKNGFFLGRCRNWRVIVASVLNVMMIGLVLNLIWLMTRPQPAPPQYYDSQGQPIDLKSVEERISFPLVP